MDILLLCLAPEVDLRYERLFGYLQDDITKKRPSVDLALNLLCDDLASKLAGRSYFDPTAPLVRHHLVYLFDDPAQPQPPLLSKYLRADVSVANYLLSDGTGQHPLDARLLPFVQCCPVQQRIDDMVLAAEYKRRLVLLTRTALEHGSPLVVYLHGAYGVGKRSVAEALCREAGMQFLCVDTPALLEAETDTL